MRLLSLLGVCMSIVAIEGKFFLSNVSTKWHKVQCNLVEPELNFSRSELKETIDVTAIDPDAWIGYISAKVPFLLLGCLELPSGGIDVDTFSQCYNLCNGGICGIKQIDRNRQKCRCVSDLASAMLQQCKDTSCHTRCYNVYMQYEITKPVQTSTIQNGDCLMCTNNTAFYWSKCANSAPKKMHQQQPCLLDSEHQTGQMVEFSKRVKFPATPRSELDTLRNEPPDQMHWTGIIRMRTLIRKSTIGNFRSMAGQRYAYVKGNNKKVKFRNTGKKKALCVRDHETTMIGTTTNSTQSTNAKHLEDKSSTNVHETTTIGTTTKSTQSTNAKHLEDQSSPNGYSIIHEATTIGTTTKSTQSTYAKHLEDQNSTNVGVSVAVLVVGGAVIIILLKRRGNMKCWQKKNVSRGEGNLFPNGQPALDTASGIDNCTPSRGKCTQSDPDIVIERNASCSQTGDTNYESVEETEEPYARVENENDNCTTRTIATARKSKTIDNVYDKLNDSRSLLIGHQDGKMHVLFQKTVCEVDNDYYFASATPATIANRSHVDEGDYNHINPPTAVTQDTKTHNMGGNTGDYNIINGNGFKMDTSDTAEYGHLQTGRT
ncbi:uncharacterized protein LOC127861007 isoform X3 [Dreissena polymorpha]|uniref:uncharacterized protein LOC127861007 isoform X3 n=1 Tax=Dreissena polymorpha TaxID=45954 RepID=UPI00226425EB|nr:uncharacterized protein LOC127861007 isoform X3 [Dreissena polymorpha]